MDVLFNIFVLVLCCGALALGASWLVDSAARIAYSLGISELVIGLTVVAFGTSAPEFAVTIAGAITGLLNPIARTTLAVFKILSNGNIVISAAFI